MSLELFSLLNQISVVLISFFALFLAFWVYLTDRKSKINQFFSWLAIFIFLWIIFSFWGNTSTDLEFATLLGRLAYGSVALLFIPFYYFPIFFLREEKKYPLLNIFVVVSTLILFFTSVFTKLIVVYMDLTKFGAIPVLGKGKFIYFSVLIFVILFTAKRFLVNYFRFSKKEKLQTQYFLVGFFIWILANLVFNIILPVFQRIPQFWALGNYSAIFFLGFTAYAIVKRELFGIKVVLTQILVGAIAILLLVQVLGSVTVFEYIWKGALFLVFLFFGYLLIRSVIREIRLREALQKAYAELEVLDKAKSEFISIASHQLRTPLTAIKGYISMLLEGTYGKLVKKMEKPMGNVQKSSQRLINLVNDLLNISRLEAGRIEMDLKENSVEDLILGIIEELKIKVQEKKIYLKFKKPKKILPKAIFDRDKIRQVLLNIIDNAIRYTEKGGITVTAWLAARKIKIAVSDTGEGMTEQELSHLFESFSRGKAGTRLWSEGTGLGLYVARRFVELHKGKIWAESAGKGKGSTFYIELPLKAVKYERDFASFLGKV